MGRGAQTAEMAEGQSDAAESAAEPASKSALAPLQALCAIARFHQVAADAATLAHQLGLQPSETIGTHDLLRAARHLGLKAKLSSTTARRLQLTPLPALAALRRVDGSVGYVILAQCDGQRVLFQDPSSEGPRPTIEPIETFATQWTGDLILIASRASLTGELARFDFSWFIPALVKYRRLLGEVLLISFMLQLFALVSPLFFQVVMDKVLVHKGLTTLDVLVIGLVVVVVFESALNGLRAYVFSHTTSRIDVELGARLFRHLVQLPLAYFQARRVGDSVARVRELENIRSFLTGNSLTVLLDVVFSVVFIAVMLFYSVPLTLIVLASLPLYFSLSLAVVPILRRRLDVKFARGAENQAMLVETVTGIQTVKAGALEPGFGRRWDNQLAAYVVDTVGDVVTELANEGIDLVYAGVTYTLPANVENLTLTGSALGAPSSHVPSGVTLPTLPANSSAPGTNGTGNDRDNVLVGNERKNTLTGGAGNDTLDGGAGDDKLIGGIGSDTYILRRGYGADAIAEDDNTAGNTDVARFADDIAYDQLWFRKHGNDLEVVVIGTNDMFSLQDWYKGSRYHVEQFRTSDGKTLLDSQVQNLVDAMAGFSPPRAGETTLAPDYQRALGGVLAANWH